MRIAYLTQSYPPMVSGASIVTEQLAKGMTERGHQVLVIAASDRENAYYSIEQDLTVLRLGSVDNPLRVGQRSLLYPHSAVMQALQEFRPDVIHTHEPLQMGWLGLEFARKFGIPITLTIHQLPWFVAQYLPNKAGIRPAAEFLLWEYARWILKRFTRVIVPTRTVSNLIKARSNVGTKTIPYGINLQLFHPDPSRDNRPEILKKFNIPDDVPLILHVGRLDADKHVERVILAAEKALEQSRAHLLIIGDGRQKPALMELCRTLRVKDRVHFTGFILDNNELAKLYRLAKIFITTSEIETQGIVLLEAAASGLPIVAVRATCIPEIVHNDINGRLAVPGDLNELSRSLIRLLENPLLAESMGKAGRTIAEKYNIKTTLDRHEKLYQVMTRHGKARRVFPKLLQNVRARGATLLGR